MTKSSLSIRQFIETTIKSFPWSYSNQETTLFTWLDYLIAGRTPSWKSAEQFSIEPITSRKIQYAHLKADRYVQELKDYLVKRFNKIDHRETFIISIDDTDHERYGKKVFGASNGFNHCNQGYQYGNTLVDCLVHSNSYMDYDFEPYLSKKWLKKELKHGHDLQTKIELAREMIYQRYKQLEENEIKRKQICVTMDAWYGCEDLAYDIRAMGLNFIMGIVKGTSCLLFGKERKLKSLISEETKWNFIKSPYSKSIVYYRSKIYYIPTLGKVKVFMIKRGKDKRIRFYATSNLKMTIQTFCKRWKDHWGVEIMHKNVKEFFNFESCLSGREIINMVHWNFSYLLYFLFRYYQRSRLNRKKYYTIHQLWESYCFEYDIIRYQKNFSSANRIKNAKSRMVEGWC